MGRHLKCWAYTAMAQPQLLQTNLPHPRRKIMTSHNFRHGPPSPAVPCQAHLARPQQATTPAMACTCFSLAYLILQGHSKPQLSPWFCRTCFALPLSSYQVTASHSSRHGPSMCACHALLTRPPLSLPCLFFYELACHRHTAPRLHTHSTTLTLVHSPPLGECCGNQVVA